MRELDLKFIILMARLALVVALAVAVNLPCFANGNFKDCCTQDARCDEKGNTDPEAKNCCSEKGTFDIPFVKPTSDTYTLTSPEPLAVNWIGGDVPSEALAGLHQSPWSQEILKVPLDDVYKLTCTYLI